MQRTIYNKDFRLTKKAHIKSFYVTTWNWLNFKAFTHKPEDCNIYNLQIGKIALALVVHK